MANRNNRRRRRNRGAGQGVLPGPSAFVEPKAKDGVLWVLVKKPSGVPVHITPTHYSVTLKGSPGQQLLHGSRCANTWTTGKVPVDVWKDVYIQASTSDTLAQTTQVWYSS
jgi:hypothetical protein